MCVHVYSVSTENTYTDDPLVSAVRGDDGSIESNQRRQSLGHPVSYHSHGAEHRTNLQHWNTHPETHTFTHTHMHMHTNSNSGWLSHTVPIVDSSHAKNIMMLKVKCVHAQEFSALQSKASLLG